MSIDPAKEKYVSLATFRKNGTEVKTPVWIADASGTPVVYTPAMWRYVMLVIRNLPRFVMRRIDF